FSGHTKTRQALHDHVHQTPSFQYDKTASSGGASQHTILRFALKAALDNPAGPRAILLNALVAPRGSPASARRRRHSPSATVEAASADAPTPYHLRTRPVTGGHVCPAKRAFRTCRWCP